MPEKPTQAEQRKRNKEKQEASRLTNDLRGKKSRRMNASNILEKGIQQSSTKKQELTKLSSKKKLEANLRKLK